VVDDLCAGGLCQGEAAERAGALRTEVPSTGPLCGLLCSSATQNRQAAVKRLANDVDLLLAIGSANSSNAIRLVEVARTAGTRAYLINDVGDIQQEWLDTARRVGITAGASTPEVLVTQMATVRWARPRPTARSRTIRACGRRPAPSPGRRGRPRLAAGAARGARYR
jgi:4-hydroxy-3-methylbut-2-enyl diphosphate reductase IspH